MIDRTARLPGAALPLVVLIENDPEAHRILGHRLDERQAMIGTDLIEADEGESAKAFERRLVEIARERGKGIVSLGSKESPTPQLRPPGPPEGVAIN